MTSNPLVAAGIDAPNDAWAGVWIAEDIELIAQGVRNGRGQPPVKIPLAGNPSL